MELKNALLIGVGGSLWFKLVEAYLQVNTSRFGLSISLSMLPYQLVWVLIWSIPITILIFKLLKNDFWLSLTPPIYYIVKDIANVFLVKAMPVSGLPYTFIEAAIIGLPIGIGWWALINYKKLREAKK